MGGTSRLSQSFQTVYQRFMVQKLFYIYLYLLSTCRIFHRMFLNALLEPIKAARVPRQGSARKREGPSEERPCPHLSPGKMGMMFGRWNPTSEAGFVTCRHQRSPERRERRQREERRENDEVWVGGTRQRRDRILWGTCRLRPKPRW